MIEERLITMPGQWAKNAQTNIPTPPVRQQGRGCEAQGKEPGRRALLGGLGLGHELFSGS